MNKGSPPKRPTPGGLDEMDVPTAQTDVPAIHFAGARKLPVTWIMRPVITFVRPTDDGGKGK